MADSIESATGMAQQPPTPAHKRGSVIWMNIGITVVAFAVLYGVAPKLVHDIIFDYGLRRGLTIIPLLLLVWSVSRYVRKALSEVDINTIEAEAAGLVGKYARPIAVHAFFFVLLLVWGFLVSATRDYYTYLHFAQQVSVRATMIPSAPEFTRYTPLQNACQDMANSISSTGEHVECPHTMPIVTAKSFGYAAPIEPSGFYNQWTGVNRGYVLLDDHNGVSDHPRDRVRRIDQPQVFGLETYWFNNLKLRLIWSDFFADYELPHYLALDPEHPDRYTAIVPKIKYAKFFQLPYWGGVVLVHDDGRMETLSPDQVRADKRLHGKWVFPTSLARKYVALQDYSAGFGIWTPLVRVEGRLEVEQLRGSNQFPLITQGIDGVTYLVTATKGLGTARGLYRMYFTDASTGVMSRHDFDKHEVVYGPGATLDRLTNLQGFQWYHPGKDGGSGIAVGIEPVYIVRPENPQAMFWKFTITNRNYSGISATAVSNSSRPDEILVFTHRHEYEAWLRGEAVVPKAVSTASPRAEVLRRIDALLREMQELRKEAEKLK